MKLQRYYEVRTDLLRLEGRREAVMSELAQARADLRSREEKLLNYKGSARSLLDALSGKREDTLEALQREVRKAEAALNALRQEKEGLDRSCSDLTRELEALPSPDVLRQEAEQTRWAALETRFCAEALLPLLEKNEEALQEYRALMRGEFPILSIERQQEISAEPNVRAAECVPYLQRLKEAKEVLGEPFDLGSYYRSPTAYLVNVAARHNRMDRINQALDQVLALKKQVRALL